MKYQYDYNKYLIIVNKDITKDWFLKAAGVNSGYALDVFSRLYDSIFSESINVVKLYKIFYKQEFISIQEMLLKKYNISEKDSIEIHNILKADSNLTLIAFDSLSYGEPVEELFFSDLLYQRIENLLLMRK